MTFSDSLSFTPQTSTLTMLRTTSHTETTNKTVPCVLLLNGFPGVGKYTIARFLRQTLGLSTARLIDSHCLLDAATAIEPEREIDNGIPHRTKQHYALRKALRKTAFDHVKASNDNDLTWILTTYTSSSAADIAIFHEYVDIARVRQIPFVMVNITCAPEVNMERMRSDERMSGYKAKWTDVDGLRRLTGVANLLCLGKDEGVDTLGVETFFKEMDSSTMTGEEAAREIATFLKGAVGREQT